MSTQKLRIVVLIIFNIISIITLPCDFNYYPYFEIIL